MPVRCRIPLRSGPDDDGSLTVELVVIAPVLFLFVLGAVVFGRVSSSHQQVIEAARAGAETAAVLPTEGDAASGAAVDAAVGNVDSDRTCEDRQVSSDLSHFYAGGYVSVTVVCQVTLSDVAFPGMPGSTTVRATATAPIDPYRAGG